MQTTVDIGIKNKKPVSRISLRRAYRGRKNKHQRTVDTNKYSNAFGRKIGSFIPLSYRRKEKLFVDQKGKEYVIGANNGFVRKEA